MHGTNIALLLHLINTMIIAIQPRPQDLPPGLWTAKPLLQSIDFKVAVSIQDTPTSHALAEYMELGPEGRFTPFPPKEPWT